MVEAQSMDIKSIALIFFIAVSITEFMIIMLFRNKISNNEINIKRQVQRNRNSTGNKQEYNSEINEETKEKKGLLKKFKIRKNEKQHR